jgi:hypothetical protein
LDAWFVGLGDDFIGRVSASSLRTRMVEGWRLRWRERELEIQVDADFPYSVARVYLVGYSRAQAQPHIEKDGKLCLGSKAVPGDRVRTVKVALAEALTERSRTLARLFAKCPIDRGTPNSKRLGDSRRGRSHYLTGSRY